MKMGKAVLLRLSDLSDYSRYVQYEQYLDSARREKTGRLKNTADKVRSLTAGLLSRYLISEVSGRDFYSIEFSAGEHGKPAAVGIPIEFSLSHSGECVLCAVSGSPVGADIERIRTANKRLSERFFHPEERETVNSDRDFFRVWTGKEAYLKMTGEGISRRLSDFSIFSEEIAPLLCTYEQDGYFITLCGEKSCNFQTISFEKLTKSLPCRQNTHK